MTKSWICRLCILLALVVSAGVMAHPNDVYPNRPVKKIVPFGPGSGTDTVVRVVTQHMQAQLEQPIIKSEVAQWMAPAALREW